MQTKHEMIKKTKLRTYVDKIKNITLQTYYSMEPSKRSSTF